MIQKLKRNWLAVFKTDMRNLTNFDPSTQKSKKMFVLMSSNVLGGLIKSKGGVGLFQILKKERLFYLLYQPSALGDNLTMWSPFLHPPKKAFLSPPVWPRREYIWKLNWKESLLICFENCQGVPCYHRQSRNRIMNFFIIVNITYVKDSLEDKFILVHFKRIFPLTSLGHSFERRTCRFVLKDTRVFPIPTQERGWGTLC